MYVLNKTPNWQNCPFKIYDGFKISNTKPRTGIFPLNENNDSKAKSDIFHDFFASKSKLNGDDDVPPNLISKEIYYSLSRLLKNLFEIGHFPDNWKIAHVTQIYKRVG